MPSQSNDHKNFYIRNLCAVLITLTVLGNFIDLCTEGSGMSQSLFLFIYSFHMPLLIFLAGSLSREAVYDRKRAVAGAVCMFLLYLSLKIIIWLVRLMMGEKPNFSLFSDSSTPWLFFSLGIYLVVGYLCRNANKRFLLVLATVFALLCGYNTSVGDYLVASRTIVFFPFFQLGQMCDIEKISDLTGSRRSRIISACILVLMLTAMVVFRKQLYVLRPMFTGRNAYKSLGKGAQVKWAYRLAAYVFSAVVSWAVLAVTPRRNMGRLISRIGEKFLTIYFWYRPVLYVLTGLHVYERLDQMLGWRMGRVAWVFCGAVLVILLSFLVVPGISKSCSKNYNEKGMDNVKKKNIGCGKYVIIYTFIFAFTFCLVHSPLLIKGFSFVNKVDGRLQHFPLLVYIGQSIREYIFGIFKGNFAMPLFDINIGLGEDILTFPASLGMLDPLVILLSPFFPMGYMEYLYNALEVFYVWLAGLSFSYLCFSFKKDALHTLIGAVVYCFGGLSLGWSVSNFSFFTVGMIQLPLLIVGANQIIRHKKIYLFVFTIFWAAINKFYSLYFMMFPVGIYVLVSCFFYENGLTDVKSYQRIKNSVYAIAKIFGAAILGVGMAGVVFIPAVYSMMSSSRSSGSVFPGSYSLAYYVDLLLSLFIRRYGEYGISCAAIVLFAVIMVFWSKNKKTKVLLTVAGLCYLSSVASYVLNGFQYLSNRWAFSISLILAYAVVETLPKLLALTKKQFAVYTAVFGAYTLFVVVEVFRGIESSTLIGVAFLGITLTILGMGVNCGPDKQENSSRRDLAMVVLIAVICNVGSLGTWLFASSGENMAYDFHKIGFETDRLENATERELEAFYLSNTEGRGDGSLFYRNTGMVWGIPTSLMSYNTVENENIIEFWKKIELSTRNQLFNHYSTDHRTVPGTLLSGKYFVATSNKDQEIPYGYTLVKTTDKGYAIYENEFALPWGYTYDSVISYDYLETLNGLERQDAMLQAIALKDVFQQSALALDVSSIPYEFTCKGCKWEDGILQITNANAAITISFEVSTEAEMYLRLEGMIIEDTQSQSIQVKYDKQTDTTNRSGYRASYYQDVTNYLYNLGSNKIGSNTITVIFSKEGKFPLENIRIFAESFKNYENRISKLKAEPLENIQWSTNRLTGTVDLSKDKILCVSVPYSKGWSATVDGEKAEILRGNYMFMCLPLTAGHHDIVFSYCSPGLKLGSVVSLASLCILVGMLAHDWRKKRAVQESSRK